MHSSRAKWPVSLDVLAWTVWLLFIVFVTVKKGLDPVDYRSVFLIYRDSALHWLQAQPLYEGSGHGFLYLPQAAALFVPIALLPESVGNMLWRTISVGVFALGVYGLCGLAGRRYQETLFLPVTIVAVLMSASAAKLGQMSLVATGMMMFAVVGLATKTWWRVSGWLVLSFALKPLSLVLMLLVAALYPRTIVPLVMFLALLVAFPFLLHDPHYVWQQYQGVAVMLQNAASLAYSDPFADVFWMLRRFGISAPESLQWLLRVVFALLTLGLCWWLRDRQTTNTFPIYLYALSVCYLLLFNPRTENNTYAMLAPALGILCVWSFQSAKRIYGYGYLAVTALYILSNRIGKWLMEVPAMWMKPLLCIALLTLMCIQLRLDDGELPLGNQDGKNAAR